MQVEYWNILEASTDDYKHCVQKEKINIWR